jgi:hypothetical protein
VWDASVCKVDLEEEDSFVSLNFMWFAMLSVTDLSYQSLQGVYYL